MPRGGPRPNSGGRRPGAGRPRKVKADALPLLDGAEPAAQPETPVHSTPAATDLTPLAYFVTVMNDPAEPAKRRDWAASMAAPYLHKRAGEEMPGKRQQAQDAAEAEARGQYAPRKPPRLVVSNG
jgi:phage terminase small subunit